MTVELEASASGREDSTKSKTCHGYECALCGYSVAFPLMIGIGAAFVALGTIHKDSCPVETDIPMLSIGK